MRRSNHCFRGYEGASFQEAGFTRYLEHGGIAQESIPSEDRLRARIDRSPENRVQERAEQGRRRRLEEERWKQCLVLWNPRGRQKWLGNFSSTWSGGC